MKKQTQGVVAFILGQLLFIVFMFSCVRQKPIRVAVTGDSLASTMLVEELEKAFPKSFVFDHYGMGGANIYEMVNRTRSFVEINVPGRLGCDMYDWIIYWVGVNDYKSPNVEQKLKDFYLTAKAAGVDSVIAITIPPYKDYYTWTKKRGKYSCYINRILFNYSDEILWSADILASRDDRNKMMKKYTTDGLHLTREGCRVIAEQLAGATVFSGNKEHNN